MIFRRLLAASAAALAIAAVALPAAQTPAPAPYTVFSSAGRAPLAVRTIGGQEMFALQDLAALFNLTVREDALAGGLTVSAGGQTIVLTPNQPLASVNGRLVSLPAAPARQGRDWFVPVDFVSRAIAPVASMRVELRKPSRLVLVGNVRVPRVAARVDPLGGAARVTIDVAPATTHTITQEGPRLIITFDAAALDATWPAVPADDLVRGIHAGDAPSTMAIDLGPRFASYKTAEETGDRGAGRLIIDIAAQPTTAPPSGAPPPTAAPEAPPLLDLPPAGSIRTIVIDPGHGGDQAGARGPGGTLEKDITLAVARRLKASLEARLGVRVVLTRDGDQTVPLDDRTSLANNNKADLFVSLHANASLRPTVSGAEVFYLSLADYGESAERAAHAGSDALPVLGGGTRDIDVILWEMAQARYIDRSAALARDIGAALQAKTTMNARAIEQAPFRVLVGANMPAVLIEMGFLTNPDQERQLASDAYQKTIVQALADGIVRYRDGAPAAGGGR